MEKTKYYTESQNVDIVERYYRNGNTTQVIENHDLCLEFVKTDYLSFDKVIFKKRTNKINKVFSDDICRKWIKLLQNNLSGVFDYKITEEYHIITLEYKDYRNIVELYLCLILMRYLWYYDNNFLVYRTIDIFEKSGLKFIQSLNLAHFYDKTERKNTFNLYNSLFIYPDADLLNQTYCLNSLNIHGSYIDTFLPLLGKDYILSYNHVYNSQLQEICKTFDENYPETYRKIIDIVWRLRKFSVSEGRVNPTETQSYFNEIQLFYNSVFNKKISFEEVTDLKQLDGNVYVIDTSGGITKFEDVGGNYKKYYLKQKSKNQYRILKYEN